MDINEFKRKMIRERFDITEDYGRIFVFIDFANVTKWFEYDRQDWNDAVMNNDSRLGIDIEKLKVFSDIIGSKVRIYFGEDPLNSGSRKFTDVLRVVFGKRNVTTKDVQKIKHYLFPEDEVNEFEKMDDDGNRFIEIRKCNFDVEISVDVLKMINYFDTFCLFSGDADFAYLNNHLKKKGKKIILIKGGYITTKLRKSTDKIINAQTIKRDIARINKTKT